jgi:hypothetical protein
MTTTCRTHEIGVFVAKIENPIDGLVLFTLGSFAYSSSSILVGALCVVFFVVGVLRQGHPRPPDNNGYVMWGVYGERPFMEAAFLDRRDAERWAVDYSVKSHGRWGFTKGMAPCR